MSRPSFHEIGFRLGQALRALLRIDEWPERFGPWIEWARDVVAFAARRARDVRLAQVAGSLTFTTVLSMVPLLAVALSVFTAFPLFSEYRAALEKMLLRELLPEQYSALILRYLQQFTGQAARLTAVGVTFLIVTSLLMIFTVDRALNDIWGVRKRRSLVQRVLVYWALLTLAPLAIGASLALSSYLFADEAAVASAVGPRLGALLDYAPFAFGALALATAYVVIPNRKVLWRDALVGGLISSALSEVLTEGFGFYIRVGTLNNIYGAFAVVPLFLLWVYLSWLALLFGAAIAATLPMLRSTRFADETRAGDAFVTSVALLAALYAARAGRADQGRVALGGLARAVRTTPGDAERLLEELERLGYVSQLDGLNADCWLLTCDPGSTDLVPVFQRFGVDPANTLVARDGAPLAGWMRRGLAADWIARPLDEVFSAAAADPGGTA